MRTRHTPPSWPLRLLLVAGLLATTLVPGRAAAAPGAVAMGAGGVGAEAVGAEAVEAKYSAA